MKKQIIGLVISIVLAIIVICVGVFGSGRIKSSDKNNKSEEKTSKVSNVFKKRIKDEAQKSDYEQLRDDIIAGKDVESLDEIIKKAKEATRTGKISTTELQNLMNNAETMKKDIASRENEEPEEKKVIINDPQEMEKWRAQVENKTVGDLLEEYEKEHPDTKHEVMKDMQKT